MDREIQIKVSNLFYELSYHLLDQAKKANGPEHANLQHIFGTVRVARDFWILTRPKVERPALKSQLRNSQKILVWCDCEAGECPQGKVGSQTRCCFWVDREYLSDAGIAWQKQINRFNR